MSGLVKAQCASELARQQLALTSGGLRSSAVVMAWIAAMRRGADLAAAVLPLVVELRKVPPDEREPPRRRSDTVATCFREFGTRCSR